VIVVDAGGDEKFAVAGGNVCAVAQGRGVAGFVVDGVIRDIGEVRDHGFPVFARGLSPIPGGKAVAEPLNAEVTCGGVTVSAGDIVVADEEGIVVVPAADQAQVLAHAKATLAAESNVTLDAWEDAHRTRIDRILRDKGFAD
jgi:regulator of RNase E activity RraA